MTKVLPTNTLPKGEDYRGARTRAICGAIAASLGDLMLLYVGNSQRPELGLAAAPSWVLSFGALLGVIGIPLYGFGYLGLRRAYAARTPTLANVCGVAGMIGCVIGAAVHALTARAIDASLAARVAAQAPLGAVAASGGALGISWAACGIAFLVASVAFAAIQWRSASSRALALMNPIVVTIAIALASMPSEWLRSFAAPASANLAHVVFYLFWSVARLGRSARVE